MSNLPERNKDDTIDNIELFQDTGHAWSCELHRKQTESNINSQPSTENNIRMYE